MARRARERAIGAFYESGGPPQHVTVDGREFWLPMVIHRMDGFTSLHAASMRAARELLPSDSLHPVSLPDGRAAVMISAFRYWEITDSRPQPTEPAEAPYAEVAVTILATLEPRPPLVSLGLMAAGLAPMAGYVPHMAVTHRLARDGGRQLWGVPKFIADADFYEDLATREVRLSEGDRHILTLSVRPGGRTGLSTQPSVLYSVRDDELVEIKMPAVIESRAALGPGHGRLELGDPGHPVVETLRRLEIAPEPLVAVDAPVIRTMFVPGRVVGTGRRVVDYEGADRDTGRFTVRHPGTGSIEQGMTAAARHGTRRHHARTTNPAADRGIPVGA
jgi:hypothetical protein